MAAQAAGGPDPSVLVKVHQASGLVSPYFQLDAKRGSDVTAGALELVNPGSTAVTVRLDPVDAITTSTLGSAYNLVSGGVHGPTTWLRIGQRLVTLSPNADVSVPVSVAIPASAGPGDYLSGVSVEALGQSQSQSVGRGLAIGEVTRYAIGVEVKTPGPRHPALAFTGATVVREPAGLVYLLNAHNVGNVILKKVHGWVRVTSGGRTVVSASIAPGTFVTGTSISYPVRASKEEPAPGTNYRIQAVLYYQGGVARLDKKVVFGHTAAVAQQNYGGRKLPQSTPWWEVAMPVAVLLAALIGAPLLLARRRRPLSRAEGLALLDRLLGPDGARPVSIVLITAGRRSGKPLAATTRSRMRRGDRLCDLGAEGLLVICPRTSRVVACALKEELLMRFAGHSQLADIPIEINVASAAKPTTAQKLVNRVKATRRRNRHPVDRPRARGRRRVGARATAG